MNEIIINWEKISFQKKYSKRAKSIRISIQNWKVILTIPKAWFFQFQESIDKKAFKFLESKKSWILKHIINVKKEKNSDLWNYSREHYLKYKEESRKLCEEKCAFWAKKMWVEYNRISIKSLKTKWGSCSSKKNLNFNYKILFLSEKNQDYLIVHELSHLIYMNHSKDFWDLVCKTLWSEKFRKYKIKEEIKKED